MDKKELKAKVKELLDSGKTKTEVFKKLSSPDIKEGVLAYYIASYVYQERVKEQKWKINIIIFTMVIQALLIFLIGLGISIILALILTLIPVIFIWAFKKNHIGAYNAYLVLTVVQLPKSIEGLIKDPIATTIGLAISIGLFALV